MFDYGVSFQGGMTPPKGDPETVAMQYARQNGISLEQARDELRAKYGDPQPPQMGMNNGLLAPAKQPQLPQGAKEITGNEIPADPAQLEQYIKDGAKKAGCSEQEFAQMIGLPRRNQRRLQSEVRDDFVNDYLANNPQATKKEAKHSFYQQFPTTRKQAKAWIKEYRLQTGASKKEAKIAFEDTFGYKVPSSNLSKLGKGLILAPFTPFLFAAGAADKISGDNLGVIKGLQTMME
ncbi:hypothetical protein IJ541_02650 [bacterium]|nr:hypothetical protein [bacterium]